MACAICEAAFTPDGPRMMVDHNHQTGEVRGVLCLHCNTGIGFLKVLYLEERGHYG